MATKPVPAAPSTPEFAHVDLSLKLPASMEQNRSLLLLIIEMMKRPDCDQNHMDAIGACMTEARTARIQLEMDILTAEMNGAPLDDDLINTQLEQIDEKERICLDRAANSYLRCQNLYRRRTYRRKGEAPARAS